MYRKTYELPQGMGVADRSYKEVSLQLWKYIYRTITKGRKTYLKPRVIPSYTFRALHDHGTIPP